MISLPQLPATGKLLRVSEFPPVSPGCTTTECGFLGDAARSRNAPSSLRPPRGKPWIERRYEQLDAGQIDPLLKTLDRQVAKHDEARTCADYVRRKRHRMRYAEFHAQGLCTSTGVLEAGCKVVIGTRLTPILFTLVGQTIALCGLFWGGLRPAKFHEKRLDIAACQNGKAAQ